MTGQSIGSPTASKYSPALANSKTPANYSPSAAPTTTPKPLGPFMKPALGALGKQACALRPRSQKATPAIHRYYLAFIRDLAAARTAPSANLQLLFL